MRITDCSSLSGFATGSTRRAGRRRPNRSRSTASGAMKLYVTVSSSPRARSDLLERAAQRCSGDRPPIACRRAGSVVGQLVAARGSARPPRSGRPLARRPRRGSRAPRPRGRHRAASRRSRGARGSPATPRARSRWPEQLRRRARCAARCDAAAARLRRDVDRPGHHPRAAQLHHQACRQALRPQGQLADAAASRSGRWPRCAGRASWTSAGCCAPFQVAASIATRVVSRRTSLRAPPMIAADPRGPSASHTSTASQSNTRTSPSSVVEAARPRARRARAARGPATRSRS